jgi:hypothetical protein
MYESGYSLRMFQILENEIINYFNYIPIEYYLGDKRKDVFSPRLSELLIRICSQIDIFFRNWNAVQSKNPKMHIDKLQFGNYKAIDMILDDKDNKIKIIYTDEILIPFNNWKINDPAWWTAYNHVKHNGFDHKTEGNLFNVIESLSALFLLNCIHEKTQLQLVKYGYIKIQNLSDYRYIISKSPNDLPSFLGF